MLEKKVASLPLLIGWTCAIVFLFLFQWKYDQLKILKKEIATTAEVTATSNRILAALADPRRMNDNTTFTFPSYKVIVEDVYITDETEQIRVKLPEGTGMDTFQVPTVVLKILENKFRVFADGEEVPTDQYEMSTSIQQVGKMPTPPTD